MNTLTELGKQIRDLFGSLTPAARIVSALMFGVILVSLGWIVSGQQSSSKSYVLGLMSKEEIHRAEEAFGNAGLGDYEVINGSRIQVPTAKKSDYLRALSDGGAVPLQWGDEIRKSLESGIFDPPSLINSRQEFGLEKEFANSLTKLPQVEGAAVNFDEKKQGFGQETLKVCSINVWSFNGRPIETTVLKHIAEAATTYFAGLRIEDVSVFDLGSANLYRSNGKGVGGDENPLLVAQSDWEEHYYGKVSELLTSYGAVKVGISVEIDPKLQQQSEKLQYDPTGVIAESTSTRKDLDTQKPMVGGRPGYEPNANQGKSLASAGTEQTSKTKESSETTRSQIGGEAVKTTTAGLVPKEVKISVGVPESYYRKVYAFRWQTDNPDSAPTDMPAPTLPDLSLLQTETESAIKDAIATIPIGIREGDDRKTFINVYSYTDLPMPEIPEPSMAENALVWLGDSWSTLAMIALVLISMGMMLSWVKTQPTDVQAEEQFADGFGLKIPEQINDELDISSGGAVVGEDGEIDPAISDRIQPAFEVTGEDMKEDLSSLIKENPDAAVNLLKTWIGDAA